jgi:hypothetical protein
MSYDAWLEIDTGGEYPARITESWNLTYNMHYALAHGGLEVYMPNEPGCPRFVLQGARASIALPFLRTAMETIKRDHDALEDREPKNGWGSVTGVLVWLSQLRAACLKHPNATIGCG